MSRPDRVVLRRKFPTRKLAVLFWYTVAAVLTIAAVWALFGDEPRRTSNGHLHPLAFATAAAAFLAALGTVPILATMIRGPRLTADRYALRVRPGSFRTLVLPWSALAELGAYVIDDEPFLLVRCSGRRKVPGDHPRWWDRAPLRLAIKEDGAASAYDLAVRMRDFTGSPRAQLAWIVRYAPNHVIVADELGD